MHGFPPHCIDNYLVKIVVSKVAEELSGTVQKHGTYRWKLSVSLEKISV